MTLHQILIIGFFLISSMVEASESLTLRVMSFNIHHGADKLERDRLDEMAYVIKESGVDLVGLQEVDIGCNRSGKVDQIKRLAELTGMHTAFAEHFAYDGGLYGQGLLSRYPLTNIKNDRITLIKKDGTTDTRALVSAVATLPDGKKVTMASVHMALDQPSRMIQAREIINFLSEAEMPVVLAGDMNAEPRTEELRLLETKFTDLDAENRLTFPVDIPVKKIDYIYVGTNRLEKILSYQVLTEQKQSDHLPIVGEFNISF